MYLKDNKYFIIILLFIFKFLSIAGENNLFKPTNTLPIFHINVYTDSDKQIFEDEIIDKDLHHKNYFSNAEYWLEIPEHYDSFEGVGTIESPKELEIKGRGNYTLNAFSKKPYKIKLNKKENLLGLTSTKSKHYCLIPHADDNLAYLRDFIGFELGKRIGLPWTPNMEPVELIINNNYRGLYFLVESIRIQEGRVDISELEDLEEDLDLVTGGYLVEIDNHEEENQLLFEENIYLSNNHPLIRITPQSPEMLSLIQANFLKHQISHINAYVGENSDDLWGMVDMDLLAKYYLVNEIVTNIEAFKGSTFLYRDRGENQKWDFGPLWDMGQSFNIDYLENFFFNNTIFHCTWIPSIVKNEKFNNKVKETWLWFMSNQYEGIKDEINKFLKKLETVVYVDYQRWSNEELPEPYIHIPAKVVDNRNLYNKREIVFNRLDQKINWLITQFGDYRIGKFEEPLKDETPTKDLPDILSLCVEKLAIALEKSEIRVGEIFKLKLTIFPDFIPDNKVTWQSSDEMIATVTQDGSVTALSVGSVIISALCGEVSTSCQINVLEPIIEANQIILNIESAELNIGETIQLQATILPEETSDKTVVWNTSDENVVSVTLEGLVTGVSKGETIITATCGEATAQCEITVKEEEITPQPDGSGIESIFANPEHEISVYSVEGILIKKECKVEDLKALNKGIYIIVSGIDRYKISI